MAKFTIIIEDVGDDKIQFSNNFDVEAHGDGDATPAMIVVAMLMDLARTDTLKSLAEVYSFRLAQAAEPQPEATSDVG